MLVCAIGNFDGVHLGHQAIVAAARAAAGGSGGVVAVTFEPLPASVLRPGAAPGRLTSSAVRGELLRAAGCDEVLELDPRDGLLGQGPEEFVRGLRERVPFDAVAEGADFRFGKGRAGDLATLTAIGAVDGFRTIEVEERLEALSDGHLVPARSTAVRWFLAMGRVADAARLLGRPHAVRGTVVPGDRRGRELGYPTANLATTPHSAIPADGVYAAWFVLDPYGAAERHGAAVSIGTNPTFDGVERRVEAYVIDVDGFDVYDRAVALDFVGRIRGQVRFDGIEPLLAQMADDVRAARDLLAEDAGG